jgi:hypothetical protein
LYPLSFSLPDGQTRASVKKYFLNLSLELYAVDVNDFLHSSVTGAKICFHQFRTKKRQTLESIAKYFPRKTSNISLNSKNMETPFWGAEGCILVTFWGVEGRILVTFSSTLIDLPTIYKAG